MKPRRILPAPSMLAAIVLTRFKKRRSEAMANLQEGEEETPLPAISNVGFIKLEGKNNNNTAFRKVKIDLYMLNISNTNI